MTLVPRFVLLRECASLPALGLEPGRSSPIESVRMARRAIRTLALLALLFALGGQTSEFFDWDHTLQTGNEADYTVVFVAAVVGSVFLTKAASRLFVKSAVNAFSAADILVQSRSWLTPLISDSLPSSSSPPLLTLRV